jgi:hypothetical protein
VVFQCVASMMRESFKEPASEALPHAPHVRRRPGAAESDDRDSPRHP